MADSGGYEGVKIESLFGSPGDAMEKLLTRQQQERMLDKEIGAKAAAAKAARDRQWGAANLKNLKDVTDPDKHLLGDAYHDKVMNTETKKVYDELVALSRTTDPTSFDEILNAKTSELIKWNNGFKAEMDFTNKRIDDIAKDNPNLNTAQLRQIATQQFDAKHFTPDVNGNMVRKGTGEIEKNQDPLAVLKEPGLQGRLALSEKPFYEMISKMPLQQMDTSKDRSIKGFEDMSSYNIGVSKLSKIKYDAKGKPIGTELRTEDLRIGRDKNGNDITLKMLEKGAYDEMMADPATSSAIEKMWLPNAQKIEEDYVKRTGRPIDAQSEDMLKRDFLRKKIEDEHLDLSYVQPKEKHVEPRPQVSINLGNQVQPFNDATSKVEFDRIGEQEPVHFPHTGVTISRGEVTDKNGNPYTTDPKHPLLIGSGHLTRQLKTLMKQQGMVVEGRGAPDYYFLKVKDGRIEAIRAGDGADDSWVARQDVSNAQLQNNTEPIKSTQKVYGNQGEQQAPHSTGKKNNDPLGIR